MLIKSMTTVAKGLTETLQEVTPFLTKLAMTSIFLVLIFVMLNIYIETSYFPQNLCSLSGAITPPLKNYNYVTQANQKRIFCLKTFNVCGVVLIRKDSGYPNDQFRMEFLMYQQPIQNKPKPITPPPHTSLECDPNPPFPT